MAEIEEERIDPRVRRVLDNYGEFELHEMLTEREDGGQPVSSLASSQRVEQRPDDTYGD